MTLTAGDRKISGAGGPGSPYVPLGLEAIHGSNAGGLTSAGTVPIEHESPTSADTGARCGGDCKTAYTGSIPVVASTH